jgi:hypothetical protein
VISPIDHSLPTRADYVRALALRLLAELDCDTYPADEIAEARALVLAVGLKCPRRKSTRPDEAEDLAA